MRVAVLSDTHSPQRWKRCPDPVARVLEGADAILHAGDVCRAETLVELETYAPVHAVLGNNDAPDVAEWGAPERLELIVAVNRTARWASSTSWTDACRRRGSSP